MILWRAGREIVADAAGGVVHSAGAAGKPDGRGHRHHRRARCAGLLFPKRGAGNRAGNFQRQGSGWPIALADIRDLDGSGAGLKIHQRFAWDGGRAGVAFMLRGATAAFDAMALARSGRRGSGVFAGCILERCASLGIVPIPDSSRNFRRRLSRVEKSAGLCRRPDRRLHAHPARRVRDRAGGLLEPER